MFKLTLTLACVALATALPTIPLVDPRVNQNANWRIVGGDDAPAGAYPFMVSIRSAVNAHFCGGSILNENWVLTAAHCLIGRSTDDTIVVAGTNTLSSGGQVRESNKLILHADYNTMTIRHDIAVINVASPFNLNSLTAAVALNTVETDVVPALLIGWGMLSTGGPLPDNLQQLVTSTITNTECAQSFGSLINPDQICAFSGVQGQGACSTDSGGPLLALDDKSQLGVVSFGSGWCGSGTPDVYARVSSYNTWISDAISL